MKTVAPAPYTTKYYYPTEELTDYMVKRLQLARIIAEREWSETDLSAEEDKLERALRTSKSRVLDRVSQAVADLTFFFESISVHMELLDIFDNDIKDLLGLKQERREVNDPIQGKEYPIFFHPDTLRRLLKAILVVNAREDKSFRRALPNILQEVMSSKMSGLEPRPMPNEIWQLMLEDFKRTAAWTGSYAPDIKEDKVAYHRALGYSFKPINSWRSYAFELQDRGKIL